MNRNFLTFIAILLCGCMSFAYAGTDPEDLPHTGIDPEDPEYFPHIEAPDLTFTWSIPKLEKNVPPSEDLTYVAPEVAEVVLKKHFSRAVTDNSNNFVSELDDDGVYFNAINAYGEMLEKTNGFVSIDGITNVCDTAFSYLKPKEDTTLTQTDIYSLFKDKCIDFATDLATLKLEDVVGCMYKVQKVDGSQLKIKFTNKYDKSGFIRKNGTLAWRFFNPGCMRGGEGNCAIIGGFAVWPSEEAGKKALHNRLKDPDLQSVTVKTAIKIWAPKSDGNNVELYNRQIASWAKLDINRRVSSLSDEEFERLKNAIMRKEGWYGKGTVEEF